MEESTVNSLVSAALEARKAAYTPNSHFAVGAALLCADGTVFTGANIESASYTPTVCAERVAFFTAVHAGKRDFTAVAVVGGPAGADVSSYCSPCGVCRQVMAEFCSPDLEVILFDGSSPRVLTLGELLPLSFGPADLA